MSSLFLLLNACLLLRLGLHEYWRNVKIVCQKVSFTCSTTWSPLFICVAAIRERYGSEECLLPDILTSFTCSLSQFVHFLLVKVCFPYLWL